MDEKIDFEITSNEQELRNSGQMRWKMVAKTGLWRTRMWLILGLLVVIFGIFILPHKFGYFVIVGGIYMILIALRSFSHFRKSKRKYFKGLKELVGSDGFYRQSVSLQDDFIEVVDHECGIKYKWVAIKEIFLDGNHLFLRFTDEKGESIIFKEDELGPDQFKRVVEFVKMKCSKPA